MGRIEVPLLSPRTISGILQTFLYLNEIHTVNDFLYRILFFRLWNDGWRSNKKPDTINFKATFDHVMNDYCQDPKVRWGVVILCQVLTEERYTRFHQLVSQYFIDQGYQDEILGYTTTGQLKSIRYFIHEEFMD